MRRSLTASILIVTLLGGALAQTQLKAIYSETADSHLEIKKAMDKATLEHKRIILDFGGNWCGDCRALDKYFHQEPNASLLKSNFVLIDVNIGHMDRNVDIAKQYAVPLNKGVPALAVLDEKGQLLYSQKNGEFEAMRTMDPGSVTEFLTHWKR